MHVTVIKYDSIMTNYVNTQYNFFRNNHTVGELNSSPMFDLYKVNSLAINVLLTHSCRLIQSIGLIVVSRNEIKSNFTYENIHYQSYGILDNTYNAGNI